MFRNSELIRRQLNRCYYSKQYNELKSLSCFWQCVAQRFGHFLNLKANEISELQQRGRLSVINNLNEMKLSSISLQAHNQLSFYYAALSY